MDKCVESKVVHLLSKPLRGVMAKGGLWWRWQRSEPLPFIIAVLLGEVGEFSFIEEEGFGKL